MNQRKRKRTKVQPSPDQRLVVDMLKQYGEALFEPCPSSEHIVLYCEDPALLSDRERHSIQRHLSVCLDCQDKTRWLTEPEDSSTAHCSEAVAVLSFSVTRESHDRKDTEYPLARAAASLNYDSTRVPPVPYIESQDGALRGEIGQDLEDRLFLDFQKLPIIYRRSLVQIQALTKDRQVIQTSPTLLTASKVLIAQRADIKPDDLINIELRFTRLKPR